MMSPIPEDPQGKLQETNLAPDPKQADRVREIFLALANTVSAMKIFPSEHTTVKAFIKDFAKKLEAYLETHEKLEVGIEEYVFTFMGKPVYRDELSIKSLPFFFFKDGMQSLLFYRGLEADEVTEFMEIIKREWQKPPEEADIVNALWERDLTNIHYYAPEEFLEQKILEERAAWESRMGFPVPPSELASRILDFQVDTSDFAKGRIELCDEDREDVERASLSVEAESDEELGRRFRSAAQDSTLDEQEVQELGSLIHLNRTISPEEEFLNLMVEILQLEQDSKHFSAILDATMEFHLEQVRRGDFANSILLIQKMQELRRYLSASSEEKASLLESFLKKITAERTPEAIRALLQKKVEIDFEALLEYLRLFGPQGYPIAADFYEGILDMRFRLRALNYFYELAAKDAGDLAALANDARPALTKEIISFLRHAPEKKTSQHFAAFLSFKSKDIKLDAVYALGSFEDELANKILAGFLSDADEEIRIQAALRMKSLGDKSRLLQIIGDASKKSFKNKSFEEKRSICDFLGRTRTEEALAFLSRELSRSPFFSTKSSTEIRLCAVSGLERMATPPAKDALARGAKSRSKSIRDACAMALIRINQAGPKER